MIPLHDENPTTSFAWVTLVLIVLNVAVFVFVQPKDRGIEEVEFAFEWAAIPCEVVEGRPLTVSENPVTNDGVDDACGVGDDAAGRACTAARQGQDCEIFPDKLVWLSLIFSMFLHGSWLHLGLNMLFLWVFGNNIEDHLGRSRFVLFYLGSGVVATFAHIAWDTASTVPLVGASGAVAGVMGAYLVWFPNAQVRTLLFFIIVLFVRIPAKWWLGVWFATQFFIDPNDGVAFMAHIGGFVVGVVVGLLVRESRRARHAMWKETYADDASGFWDNRFGGRSDNPLPPHQGERRRLGRGDRDGISSPRP